MINQLLNQVVKGTYTAASVKEAGTVEEPMQLQGHIPYSGFQRINNRLPQPINSRLAQPDPMSRDLLYEMAVSFRANNISTMYRIASEKNGGFVKIEQKFSCLPLLEGKDGEVTFVYEIVEEIEAILDFHELHNRFTALSYPQLVGAVSFLRSLALFNRKGIDLDVLQDEDIERSPQFQGAVAEAMLDEEAVRVLAAL